MIYSLLKIPLLSILNLKLAQWLTLCLMTFLSTVTLASNFQKVDLDESDFFLFDIKLKNTKLISSIEAYKSGEQILLPIGQLITALGGGVDIDLETGKLLITMSENTTVTSFYQDSTSIKLSEIDPSYFWGRDDFELYISHLLLEQLLQSKIRIVTSALLVEINSISNPFPIEKLWQRQQSPINNKDKTKNNTSTFYIPDKYQLFTSPTADIALSLGANNNSSKTVLGYNIQTSSDILYHSARISLNQNNQSNKLSSRINLSRHQPSPTDTMWGGVREYSFGDISSSNHALLNNVSSGLGIRLSSRPENLTNNFGTKNIEGDATPGWDVELYHNGFLLKSQKVPDDGHYLFENIETEYGNNHFEIRLFGPYGEEEIRRENVSIGENWLPKGNIAYDMYFLERNQKVLDNSIDLTSEFGSDYGLSLNFSPFNNTHIGSIFQQSRDSANEGVFQKYVGTHIQSSFSDIVLKTTFIKQLEHGHRLTSHAIGRFPWGQNYSVSIEDERDFSTVTTPENYSNFRGSFSTGGRLPLLKAVGYRTNIVYVNNDSGLDSWLLGTRLSWRLSKFNFSNTWNYLIPNQNTTPDFLSGNMNMSYKQDKFRLNSNISYNVSPSMEINSVSFGGSWRSETESVHSLSGSYSPKRGSTSNTTWSTDYIYSSRFDAFNFSVISKVDSQKNWAINLGVNFFFDYDANNNRMIMSSQSSSASGNLNIKSYLDRNSNNRRDEGDYTLRDIQFSPLSVWETLTSNQQGEVSLPGVPVYNAFTFSAKSNDYDIETKSPSYTIYTHPGSRLDIELPFTVTTNISGFVEVGNIDNDNIIPLTTGTLRVINLNTNDENNITLDLDGYYEMPRLQPGNYQLKIADSDLKRLKLVAKNGSINFVTPEHGGYYELPPIVLLRNKGAPKNLPKESRLILNEDNGESYYFDSKEIYAKPEVTRLAISGERVDSRLSKIYAKEAPLEVIAPSGVSDEALQTEAKASFNASNDVLAAEASGSFQHIIAKKSAAFSESNIDNNKIDKTTNNQYAPNAVNKTSQQNPELSTGQYTIQLLASSQSDTIPTFIKRFNLDQEKIIVSTREVNGTVLQVLNYGVYTSTEAAGVARSNLPLLVRQKSWIRKK